MLRLRIIHHLRTTAFLVVLTLILGAAGTLIWANHTGMPKSWRQAIERGIAKHGIHVEIGGLSYNPLQGITARNVKVFASDERKQVISRLEGIILDLNNAKLAKGEIQLSKVKLSKARLILAVDPDDPNSEVLEINNIQGELIPPGNPHIEVRNARGTIGGIELILNAKITDDLKTNSEQGQTANQEGNSELLAKVIRELRQWSFSADAPPQIRIQCIGRRSEMDQLKASISFRAQSIEKKQHSIDQIVAEAELHENLLTVSSITATNNKRRLDARLDYKIDSQHGRFDCRSTLEIPELLQSWLGIKPFKDLLIAGNQELNASGEFQLIPGSAPDVHTTGHARVEFASLRGIRFDEIDSDFSWHNGDLFLKEMSLNRPDGRIQGKALIQDELVRLDLKSTLLPEFYRPLVAGKVTEKIINEFSTNSDSAIELELEGGYDRRDPKSWAFAGKASLRSINYRGVDIAAANTKLSISSSQMDFTDGTIIFDYSDYSMAKRYDGPKNGQLNFKSVRYRRGAEREINFSGLDGEFWPAPVCRLFLTKTADHLERYGFHHPPQIAGSGTIGIDQKASTLIDLDFSTNHDAEYVLMNAPVSLSNSSGKVLVTGAGVNINTLKTEAFGGNVLANLKFPRGQKMNVEIEADLLSVDSISSTYGMNMDCGGYLSGMINFVMMPGETSSMDGNGKLKLSKAELFSVPIFGPLSNVLQAVLGDKQVGTERAKEASCSFIIKDGVSASNDFKTTTTSLIFAGDGWVDLDKKTMDMTLRLNARGLLGFLTIPLRPFYGLFQFRGTGPLKKPNWERVMFTKPNEKAHWLLLKNPAKAE